MSIIIFVVILLVLVLVHEFGHFFTAKSLGIKVEEFGFGFPPKLFGIKKGETEYSLNALPFGGFVKIYGEDMEEADFLEVGPLDTEKTPEEVDLAKRSLVNKPKYQQAMVLFAGIFANFLLAWFLFSVGFISGLPTSLGSQPDGYTLSNINLVITSVVEKSPAEKAGLKAGDKIVSIGGDGGSTTYISPDTVKSFVMANEGKTVNIEYLRGKDSTPQTAKVVPTLNTSDNQPEIGISMDEVGTLKLPLFRAVWEGLRLDWNMTKNTVVGLYTLIKEGIEGKGSLSEVTGPVGMIGLVGDAYRFGFVYLLSFTALISINLAIINLFPFPALDGGRLLFLLIEKIKGSRINPKVANTANMIGFYLLIILMLLITYHDLIKLF